MYAIKSDKKYRTGSFACFCFFTGILMSCVSASAVKKMPQWVIEASAVYPDGEYLCGVGYAKDRNSAESAAVAVLTKSISQKVKAQTSSVQTMDSEKEGVGRRFASEVNTLSLINEIVGLKIQEVWTAPDGDVYALALINREEVGSYYEKKITDNENGINAFIAMSAENPASFESIRALNSAVRDAAENDGFISILAVVHPLKYKRLSLAYKNTQTVQALRERELQKIHIAVEVADDNSGRIASAFSQVFKEAGFKTLSEKQSGFTDAPYILKAVLSVEPLVVSASSQNKYVRYVLKAELTDTASGKVVLPWTASGREAHFTESEAEQRALRTLESLIKNDFSAQMLTMGN
ncbi:LPP20 family lipoprotein [Treponema sp. OMZ 840]|uniref:LPP20 family lipoprotein n=1 Tax=Treponema sp. OMZ 840 TaxID=244313 RepID=UPI003D9486DF